MEPTSLAIIASIFALIGTITQAYLTYKNNSIKNAAEAKKIDAEAENIKIEAGNSMLAQMRIQLEIQGAQIRDLQTEINFLKSQEKIHLIEKIRLEERIQNLTKENEELRVMVEKDKISYTSEILGLNDRILQLINELNTHKKNK